jgi:hypothetical protein
MKHCFKATQQDFILFVDLKFTALNSMMSVYEWEGLVVILIETD